MDHGNPGQGSFFGVGKADGLATQTHFATVGALHSSNDLHHRALARAVFSHQEMDFARADVQTTVAKGGNATEAFLQRIELKQHRN